MLSRLSIQNYALIEELDIEFPSGLTIITGETGAGKSILLGALSMILGQRADIQALLNKEKKCIIEGKFNIKGYGLKDFFSNHDLDYEDTTLIRREVNTDGKSRAFVNDTPVNLNVLKELGVKLVDIHSQHETLTLSDYGFQLSVTDACAGHHDQLAAYLLLFKQYRELKRVMEELTEKENQSKKDLDYFQFQFSELDEAKLTTGEKENLEQDLQIQNNAEEIKQKLSGVIRSLTGEESNLTSQLSEINTLLSGISKFNPGIGALLERLKSTLIELKDIGGELENLDEEIVYDPGKIEEITIRLDLLYRLEQKHRVNTTAELIAVREDLSAKLETIGSLETQIAETAQRLEKLKKQLEASAQKISSNRKKVLPEIERNIQKSLSSLNMPHAVLKIENNDTPDDYHEKGIDHIRFLFSANKGVEYKELHKVASGGELSRLMLCIKSLVAKLTSLPTVIFDEIDTGVSGEVAFKVGGMMEAIAKGRQVISITHLPQIAGKGECHYLVFKETKGNKTSTSLKKLNKEDRIREIARMLSGDHPTKIAIENARELLNIA